MFYHFVTIAVLLSFTLSNLNGQGYQAPHTRMPNNLIKSFIQRHMVYPEEAMTQKEEGTVIIAFDIDKNGRISNTKVTKSVSEIVDKTAIKLFELILWNPSKYLGKTMDGSSEFKIRFNIKRYETLVKKRGYDQIKLPYEPLSKSLKIYTVRELNIAPEAIFDSTYKSHQNFITQNLALPDAALKLNMTGDVKLQFLIEVNGLPSNIMVIESLGGGCTEEAIRIVQLMSWVPGIKNNEAVRTCYNLSFKFDPADEIKSKHIPNQSNSGI